MEAEAVVEAVVPRLGSKTMMRVTARAFVEVAPDAPESP
jgi:hypothetical protein